MMEIITAMMEDGKWYFMDRPDKLKKVQEVYEKLEEICVEVPISITNRYIVLSLNP